MQELITIIIAFLTGRDRLAVVESYVLRDLRRRVAATLPHGFDTTHDQLRPKSVEDFRELARCARHFAGILGRVMGRDRQAFVAFLVGLHAPSIQQRLLEETDPFAIGEIAPDVNEYEVKRRSITALESILSDTAPATRQRVYSDIRVVHHMMALSSFQYDRFIAAAEHTIMRTSTGAAPWTIVDSVDAHHRSIFVGKTLRDSIRTHLAAREAAQRLHRHRRRGRARLHRGRKSCQGRYWQADCRGL